MYYICCIKYDIKDEMLYSIKGEKLGLSIDVLDLINSSCLVNKNGISCGVGLDMLNDKPVISYVKKSYNDNFTIFCSIWNNSYWQHSELDTINVGDMGFWSGERLEIDIQKNVWR